MDRRDADGIPLALHEALLALALALAGCEGASVVGPAGTTPCGVGSGAPGVALGFGETVLASLAEGEVAPQVLGPQGGSHIAVGARLRGMRAPVELSFEARDAFTSARLGLGRLPAARPTEHPDAPPGACDVRGALLYLNTLFPGGAGLADVRVTARDATGSTATDARRVWIGRALPACAPRAGAERLVPLALASSAQRRDEAAELVEGAVVWPSPSGDVLLLAGTEGMAASAVSLTARIYDERQGRRELRAEARATPPTDEATTVPVMRRAAPECVAPVGVRLPLDPSLRGRPLWIALTADDGLGPARTVERRVTLGPVEDAAAPGDVADVTEGADVTDAGAVATDASADAPADIAPGAADAGASDVPTQDVPPDGGPRDAAVPADAPTARNGLALLAELSFGLGAHARELEVDGDAVYVADSNGLPVVALRSGGAGLLHAIPPAREQHCSTVALHRPSGTLVCAAGDSGYLDLVDVRDPGTPRSRPWNINEHDPARGPPIYEVSDVAITGDVAWLAAHRSGLLRASLGPDGMPISLARTGIGVEVVGVVADGVRLALLDRAGGLAVYALPDLAALSRVSLDGPPLDLALDGDRFAVALGSAGARVFRLAGNTLAPVVRVQPRCVATAVALAGDLLAVACLTGVTLYDLRGAAPRVAGFYPARYGMLDVAFTPRGLLVTDWYGLLLLGPDPDGAPRMPDVPLALRLGPGADARIGVRNPGDSPAVFAWRVGLPGTGPRSGELAVPASGDAVLTLPFASLGLAAGAPAAADVWFSAGESFVATRVAWRGAGEEPARGVVAVGDRFPTLRRTVASPHPPTLPPAGAPTLVMFLTVDCFLQWPQLEDMAWSRRHGGTQPSPTILYLTTDDLDPFDPLFFLSAHDAEALPTFEWADYSRSVPGLEAQTNFVRGFEDTFMMRLPGADFPHDYLVGADGVVRDTLRSFRGAWPLPTPP